MESLFPGRRDASSRWYRIGFRRLRGRRLDVALGALVVAFTLGWGYGISVALAENVQPRWMTRITTSPLARDKSPETAYLLDLAVSELAGLGDAYRGRSGAVRVVIRDPGEGIALPDSLPDDVELEVRPLAPETADSLAEDGAAGGTEDGATGGAEGGEAGGEREPPGFSEERERGLTAEERTALHLGEEAAAPGARGARPGASTPSGRSLLQPPRPGIWGLLLRSRGQTRWVPGVTLVTRVPFSEKREGRLGRYLLGTWPFEGGETPPSPEYGPPAGFVEVTRQNVDLRVSDHLRLGDFLTKGQGDVWPKYLVLSPLLLDKVELTLQELEEMGHPVEEVGIISGFRTPRYNVAGGDTQGRASLSRHMYGDALDFYIDNDGDGRMDDLNGDGRVDVRDAAVVARAASRVEEEHPDLVGGIGTYAPTGAHAGFVHVDTRGTRARW